MQSDEQALRKTIGKNIALYRKSHKDTQAADEVYDPNETLMIFDPISTWKKTWLKAGTYTIRELLVPVFLNGECVYESPSVMDIRDYCAHELDTLWDESRRLVNPQEVYVDLSKPLWDLKNTLLDHVHNFDDK